jgi:membrane fusion protein, heavy metal efflux system
MKRRDIYLKISLALLLFYITGCTNEVKTDGSDKSFCLTDTMARMIKIDTARKEQVKDELILNGKVDANEDKVIKIYPFVSGNVEEVNAQLGDYVQKGQTLAVIKSADVANYQQQYTAAKAGLAEAQKTYDADADMYKAGMISDKDYTQDKNELAKAQATYNQMTKTFQIYNINENSDYVIKSPVSGFIIDRKINPGQQFRTDNTDNVFTISDLKDVWVLANVYETDIAKIKSGYDATITTLSYPNKVFHGKVDKVYDMLDPDSKVLNARITLDNPGYLLKPEMFANVSIRYAEDTQMVAIPTSAVIFNMSKNYVIVYNDKCHLKITPVIIYKTVGNITYISDGVKPGDMVVSKYESMVFDAMNM